MNRPGLAIACSIAVALAAPCPCAQTPGGEPRSPNNDSSIESAPGELAGLRGKLERPEQTPWWLKPAVAGGTLVVGALIASMISLARHRRREPMTRAVHELSLEALDALLAKPRGDAPNDEAMIEQLSALLRTYIERRFDIAAPERTTEEFLNELDTRLQSGDLSLDNEQRSLLERFLREADVVKFAQGGAAHESAAQAGETVRAFLRETADERVRVPIGPDGAVIGPAFREADQQHAYSGGRV